MTLRFFLGCNPVSCVPIGPLLQNNLHLPLLSERQWQASRQVEGLLMVLKTSLGLVVIFLSERVLLNSFVMYYLNITLNEFLEKVCLLQALRVSNCGPIIFCKTKVSIYFMYTIAKC